MEKYYEIEIEIQKQMQQLALLNEKKREKEDEIAKIENMYVGLNRKIHNKKIQIGNLERKKYTFYDLKNLMYKMKNLSKDKIPVFYAIVSSEFWEPLKRFLKKHFHEPSILKPSGLQVNLHYTVFVFNNSNNGRLIYSEKKNVNDFTVNEIRNGKPHDKNEAHFIFDDAFALNAGIQKEMEKLYPMTPEILKSCRLTSSNSNFKIYEGTFNVPILVFKGKTTINDMLTKK